MKEEAVLKRLIKQMEKTMAAIDDLKSAVTTLQTTVDNAVGKLAALEAQIAAGNNDAAIAQAATDITTASTKLASA